MHSIPRRASHTARKTGALRCASAASVLLSFLFTVGTAHALMYTFTSDVPGRASGTLEIDASLGQMWGSSAVRSYSIDYEYPSGSLLHIDSNSTDPAWSASVFGALATESDPFNDFPGDPFDKSMYLSAWEDQEFWVYSTRVEAVFQPAVAITWQLVPEPGTGMLAGVGLIALGLRRTSARRAG